MQAPLILEEELPASEQVSPLALLIIGVLALFVVAGMAALLWLAEPLSQLTSPEQLFFCHW